MGGFRKFDLFGTLWCLGLAITYATFFVQGERIAREVGVPFSETGIVSNWFFYSALLLGMIAALAVFLRPLLWVIIGIVILRNGLLAIGGLMADPDVMPGAEWLRLVFRTSVAVMGSYFVLRWRREKVEYETEKNLSEEFD